MEGQTSVQPRGTNHPFHKQGFCPTNEDYSGCTAGLELLRMSCSTIFCKWVTEEGKATLRRSSDCKKLSENLYQPFFTRKWIYLAPETPPPTPTNSAFLLASRAPSQWAFGEKQSLKKFPWCGLFWHATKAKCNPIPRPDRLFCTYANFYCCALRFSPGIATGFDLTLNILPWVIVSKATKVQTTKIPQLIVTDCIWHRNL